ncbi:MAG TPA: hypothetical protein VGQ00_03055 [Candidatus Norongarragalinales archaeon]|nr:hypothetical protein [Candidatus Norongarragalinales archaeon]
MLEHSASAWKANAKLLAFFSVPFLIVLPLAALLPNFVALSGIFLRFGSVQTDLTMTDSVILAVGFVASLALISFALAAVNVVIKGQRTLHKLRQDDIDLIESATIKLFVIYLAVFLLSLLANMALYDVRVAGQPLHMTLGALFSFLFAAIALFAPQAVVIDQMPIDKAVQMSFSVLVRRASFTILFFILAIILLAINTAIFLSLDAAMPGMRFISLAVNGLLILPFLEVLKTQIYLSKYTLLQKI